MAMCLFDLKHRVRVKPVKSLLISFVPILSEPVALFFCPIVYRACDKCQGSNHTETSLQALTLLLARGNPTQASPTTREILFARIGGKIWRQNSTPNKGGCVLVSFVIDTVRFLD